MGHTVWALLWSTTNLGNLGPSHRRIGHGCPLKHTSPTYGLISKQNVIAVGQEYEHTYTDPFKILGLSRPAFQGHPRIIESDTD